jgi:hypothetical protein
MPTAAGAAQLQAVTEMYVVFSEAWLIFET